MQGRAERGWGAMGGGTKTMVGVVLPWKSMTNGGLDPIKHSQKNGDLFSFSGDLSFILSNCDPKCQALQLIFHCCHPDTLATGMDLTQWSYKNDQPAGCVLKVILWASWYWITWFVTNQFGSLTVEVYSSIFACFFSKFILLQRTLCKIKKHVGSPSKARQSQHHSASKILLYTSSDEVVH